jgi:hypothetical protein
MRGAWEPFLGISALAADALNHVAAAKTAITVLMIRILAMRIDSPRLLNP